MSSISSEQLLEEAKRQRESQSDGVRGTLQYVMNTERDPDIRKLIDIIIKLKEKEPVYNTSVKTQVF